MSWQLEIKKTYSGNSIGFKFSFEYESAMFNFIDDFLKFGDKTTYSFVIYEVEDDKK